jgi:hypothetical protein
VTKYDGTTQAAAEEEETWRLKHRQLGKWRSHQKHASARLPALHWKANVDSPPTPSRVIRRNFIFFEGRYLHNALVYVRTYGPSTLPPRLRQGPLSSTRRRHDRDRDLLVVARRQMLGNVVQQPFLPFVEAATSPSVVRCRLAKGRTLRGTRKKKSPGN